MHKLSYLEGPLAGPHFVENQEMSGRFSRVYNQFPYENWSKWEPYMGIPRFHSHASSVQNPVSSVYVYIYIYLLVERDSLMIPNGFWYSPLWWLVKTPTTIDQPGFEHSSYLNGKIKTSSIEHVQHFISIQGSSGCSCSPGGDPAGLNSD